MRDSDVKKEIDRMTDNWRKTNMNQNIQEVILNKGFARYDDEIEKVCLLIINECIKELEISRRCDPYTGKLYDSEYNACIGEQIEVLKARFGVK